MVPASDRCRVLSETLSSAAQRARAEVGAAFASSYWLGHHGNTCLSGLNLFTLVALRPAHSLSTLRSAPRGDERKTRYSDLAVFPLTGLNPGTSPGPHPLVSSNLVTHMTRSLHPLCATSGSLAAHAMFPGLRTQIRPSTPARGLRPCCCARDNQRALCGALAGEAWPLRVKDALRHRVRRAAP